MELFICLYVLLMCMYVHFLEIKYQSINQFQTRFPKSGPAYRRQMANLKPWNSPVEYRSRESKYDTKEVTCTTKYSKKMSRDRNIPEDAYLQNQNYLVIESLNM